MHRWKPERPRERKRWWLPVAAALPLVAGTLADADAGTLPTAQGSDVVAARRSAVEAELRHIYSIYFGLRACSEIGTSLDDRSFMPAVSLDEARTDLKRIEAAAAEVRIDTDSIWHAGGPQAVVTAEALKTDPSSHLEQCHRMTSLFRVDLGNLQANLGALGAKGTLIVRDY